MTCSKSEAVPKVFRNAPNVFGSSSGMLKRTTLGLLACAGGMIGEPSGFKGASPSMMISGSFFSRSMLMTVEYGHVRDNGWKKHSCFPSLAEFRQPFVQYKAVRSSMSRTRPVLTAL